MTIVYARSVPLPVVSPSSLGVVGGSAPLSGDACLVKYHLSPVVVARCVSGAVDCPCPNDN